MLKHLTENIDLSTLIVISGLAVFGYWLLKTSLGRNALGQSKPRRNSMGLFLPLVVMLGCMVGLVAVLLITESIFEDLTEDKQTLLQNVVQGMCSIVFSAGILVLTRHYFARGFKGLGLNFKNIGKDFACAVGVLLAAWPIVIAVIIITTKIARLIYGADYQMQSHEELELIRKFSQPSVRTAILINGAIVTPLFEEILFRGLFQTVLRSYVIRPWPAIFISSGIFAIAHANGTHWPALFVLGIAMGYAYEKSGSLLRPMIIHSLFNGITILAVMAG